MALAQSAVESDYGITLDWRLGLLMLNNRLNIFQMEDGAFDFESFFNSGSATRRRYMSTIRIAFFVTFFMLEPMRDNGLEMIDAVRSENDVSQGRKKDNVPVYAVPDRRSVPGTYAKG